MVLLDNYGSHIVKSGDYEIIDEIEILKNNFKINKVNYTYNDISFELYNHNGKYYFFHYSIYDKILKSRKNPYNNQYLDKNILNRIYHKKKLNDIIFKLKSKSSDFNFNHIYNNFNNVNIFIKNKYLLYFIQYFNFNNINLKYVNENQIMQIITNLGFDIKNSDFDLTNAQCVIGYLLAIFKF